MTGKLSSFTINLEVKAIEDRRKSSYFSQYGNSLFSSIKSLVFTLFYLNND